MELYGKLFIDDNNEKGEFEIETETRVVNISQLLDNIFESALRPQVYIRIMRGNSLIFEESGGLLLCRDRQGVDSYHICGLNLSKLLWDNTEEYIEIIIRRGNGNRNYGKTS